MKISGKVESFNVSNSFKLVYGYSPSEFVMKHREGGKISLNDGLSAE